MSTMLAPEAFAPVKPRSRAGRGANAHPRLNAPSAQRHREAAWVHVPAPQACEHVAPVIELRPQRVECDTVPVVRLAPAAPAAPRYEWTNRGIAVLLTLVGLVFAVMVGTIVTAYLAVSDAPPTPNEAPAAAALVQPVKP